MDFLVGLEEHLDFHYATDQDWDRAAASEIGAAHPDRAWVLTDRDVWHKNPYYSGPPVPHPEDDYEYVQYDGPTTPPSFEDYP